MNDYNSPAFPGDGHPVAGVQHQDGGRRIVKTIMATPAISDGLIVVRTLGHLYGIGQ